MTKIKIIRALLVFAVLAGMTLTGFKPREVLAQEGTKTIYAGAINDHGCDDTEWHFVINQIEDPVLAPGSITVSWANGASEVIQLGNVTGGVAHYSTTLNLNSPVISASAEIYEGWEGQFNLSHGPCSYTPTNTPFPTSTSTYTVTPTNTPTNMPTSSSTPTNTPTGTLVPTSTPTSIGTTPPTETSMPTITPTRPPAGGFGPNDSSNTTILVFAGALLSMLVFFVITKK